MLVSPAIDWNGQPEVDARRALLRGDVIAKTYERFGNLGVFRVAESWQATVTANPTVRFTAFGIAD